MATKKQNLKQQIVDTALNLADKSSWEAVRLHDIADELKISLEDIRQYFREKEDIIDAWFDQADKAMLTMRDTRGFDNKKTNEKLHDLLMSWLALLGEHRRVTRQMIFGKFEPGHIHYQVKGLLRVSRTVQWLREAAGITSTLPMRAFEEAALTSLYLATFFKWMLDDSENSQSTSRFLKRSLDSACRLSTRCNRQTLKQAPTAEKKPDLQKAQGT